MRNDSQKLQGAVPRNGRGNGLFYLKTCLRIVSSGASTVASTVRSAGASVASSIAERYEEAIREQVHWAGFDKVECVGGILRQVLLLAYQHGFQVWDVEEADDVRQLASNHDGPVSFLQIQKNPILHKKSEDWFAEFRPLLVVAGDIYSSGGGGINSPSINGSVDSGSGNQLPTAVRFYSIRSHEYIHVLKFRAAVYSVRCSPRVVAISQASQIHCFNSASLEREYTILTHPVAYGHLSSGSIGYGPLAVGPRWLAYSGAPLMVPNANRVSPENLTPVGLSSSPNESVVVYIAKESSKQLAAGIVTLGDLGYKKLTKYYSEILPDKNGSTKSGSSNFIANGVVNGDIAGTEDIGMVIVRDIVSKSVVVQIRAHKSPISALCFDPSGTLLVTASIRGHNINVFHIMPCSCSSSSAFTGMGSSVHLYKLQRGITNAVIQDISFSDDSRWIMISSSRGTSHLFGISPSEGTNILLQNANCSDQSYRSDIHYPRNLGASKLNYSNLFSVPITLSAVSRIKNGNNGWKGAVNGAAAAAVAATGKVNSISRAIASTFHNCKASGAYLDANSSRTKYHVLLFSPSGCIIQYVLRRFSGEDSSIDAFSSSAISPGMMLESDSKFFVEPLQKWDICHKRNRRERNDNVDAFGEHGDGENAKLFQKLTKKVNSVYPSDCRGEKMKLQEEENHNHLYISEVELQMYSSRVPLWTMPGISFQMVVDDTMLMDDDGEIEIEKLSYQTVEARSENLKPVLDHVHGSNSIHLRSDQDTSSSISMNKSNSSSSEHPEHPILSRHNSFNSFDPIPDSLASIDPYDHTDGNYFNKSLTSAEPDEGFVNKPSERPLIIPQLQHVNTTEEQMMDPPVMLVNRDHSLELGGHTEDAHSTIS